jgi:hypothetical protein
VAVWSWIKYLLDNKTDNRSIRRQVIAASPISPTDDPLKIESLGAFDPALLLEDEGPYLLGNKGSITMLATGVLTLYYHHVPSKVDSSSFSADTDKLTTIEVFKSSRGKTIARVRTLKPKDVPVADPPKDYELVDLTFSGFDKNNVPVSVKNLDDFTKDYKEVSFFQH